MILEIGVGLDYAVEGRAIVLLQVEAAALADQRVLTSRTRIAGHHGLARVPADDRIGERTWTEVEGRLRLRYAARVAVERPAVDLGKLAEAPMHALPGEVVKYLMGSRFVAPEKFERFAEAEFGGLSGGARVLAMRDWIEAHLDYVRGSSDEETTAIDTFVERQGICRDYAHLMVALARASRIPARMVSVYAPSVEPPDFHAVAEVWLDGSWHLVDATGMARPEEMARIGVGRDAADIPFMLVYGASELKKQSVSVLRADDDAINPE